MGKSERKKRLVGPWRRLHLAVWLFGLAIIAWRDWWWPGILVLLAISALIEAWLLRYRPEAFEEEKPVEAEAGRLPNPPQNSANLGEGVKAAPIPEHRGELLPSNCPKCGGPIRSAEVKWTGSQSADCPYCGAKLPMAMAQG